MEDGYGMDFEKMDEGLKMDQSRNILQRMGAPGDKRSQEEGGYSSNMSIKQEVPYMWKNNLSLENIANDFLESNVTGEVMNLDDFLKELQVNEIMQQSPGALSSRNQAPRGHTGGQEADRKGMDGGREMAGGRDPRHIQDRLQDMHDRYSMIRPANIDELKEQIPVRPPIMHHVGKPPELYQKHQETTPHQHANSHPHTSPHPHASPHPHVSPHQGMPQTVPHQHARDPGIPQASVRPLVRPVNQSPERLDRLDRMDRGERMDRIERMDRMERMERMKREMDLDDSEKRLHDMSENESDGDDSQIFQNGFTSTACVKFSQDDLRLATIPGQDFDPATRRFSEEELKPQPIIRKRKKQFVPEELKNNKYWAKRCKNNEAAKRSREARRFKENQIAMRARYLEEENNALKGEVDHLKKENTDLKQMMVALEEKLNQMTENR